MPIPTPKENENKSKFIQRCMVNATMIKEYKDTKQRSAICYSQYERK